MKKFCIKLVCFVAFMIAIDRPFVVFKYKTKNLFTEISSRKLVKLRQYIDSSKIKYVDIAVYGSSHPQFGVASEVISKETGMSCLNFAYGGGSNIGAQYAFINKLGIKSRIMIYAIDVSSLNQKPTKTDDFQKAFFSVHYSLFDFSQNYMTFSNIYMYSHFIKSYMRDAINGQYSLPYFRDSDKVNLTMFRSYSGYEVRPGGWVAGDGYMNREHVLYANLTFQPYKEANILLKMMADYCLQNNTKLIIVQLPESAEALKFDLKYKEFDRWMNRFAAENKVSYVNFDRPESFPVANDSLFFDTDHLNKAGAILFSKQLAQVISISLK